MFGHALCMQSFSTFSDLTLYDHELIADNYLPKSKKSAKINEFACDFSIAFFFIVQIPRRILRDFCRQNSFK